MRLCPRIRGPSQKQFGGQRPSESRSSAALRGFAQGNLRPPEHWTDYVSCPYMQHHHHNISTKRNAYALNTKVILGTNASLEPNLQPNDFQHYCLRVSRLRLKPASLAQRPVTFLEQTSWRSRQLLLSLYLCLPFQTIDSPLHHHVCISIHEPNMTLEVDEALKLSSNT